MELALFFDPLVHEPNEVLFVGGDRDVDSVESLVTGVEGFEEKSEVLGLVVGLELDRLELAHYCEVLVCPEIGGVEDVFGGHAAKEVVELN